MLPSSAELEYFLEVASALNLSRASERLGISQPSLSLAMKRLEESLSAQLFIRHKKGVLLTQAGKELVGHARQLLHYWQHTKSQTLLKQQEIQGYFTLGCSSSIAIYMVTQFLPALLESHAKLEIHLKHDISRKITEQVINLSLDIGIVVNPLKHPNLIMKKLCSDEFTFWRGPGKLAIQDVRSPEAVILCEPELRQTQALLKKAKKAGLPAERIVTMNSLEVVAALTAQGCGIGILPVRVAQALYANQLKRIPNMPVYADQVFLIYRSENKKIQAIQEIVEAIKKSAA